MDWDHLNEAVGFAVPTPQTPLHSRNLLVHRGQGKEVWVARPGRHWNETYAPGGDFVVSVMSSSATTLAGEVWDEHKFTHADLFHDFESKVSAQPAFMRDTFAPALVRVTAEGADAEVLASTLSIPQLPGLEVSVVLVASQCLALAEHRRYRAYEPSGGRCMPTRFAIGIIFGIWSASYAANVQKSGARGLNQLRREARRAEPTFEVVLGRPLTSPACKVA